MGYSEYTDLPDEYFENTQGNNANFGGADQGIMQDLVSVVSGTDEAMTYVEVMKLFEG
jgi:hypothetical protein